MNHSISDLFMRARAYVGLPLLLLLSGVGLTLSIPSVAEAQLRVSSIDWVQGRPEIPHPAMNGKNTILQAIAEGGNCGGNYSYRWDTNGDGDFDDGGEHWRGANYHGHRRGYFAPLGLEMRFPDQPGDRIFYPKVEVDCAGQRVSTVVPYLVRVDRVCPNYPNDFNGGCREAKDENINLTRALVHDRIIDRTMWWMFNQIDHYDDDGRRGGVHGCRYWGEPQMYGQGMMLNVFLRRSHGYGPGRDIDAYYRHVTQCGLSVLMGTYNMSSGMWFNDDAADGWDGWKMSYTGARLGGAWYYGSYGSTAWVEPAVNFGNPEYRAPGGEDRIRGRTLRDIGGDLRDGVLYCMAGSGQWYYSCRSDGHPDASTNGWAPESMRLLGRKFNMNTYSWARDRQRGWLNQHCSMNSNNDHRLFGCNYHVEWGYNGGVGKLAGNALVGYGWTQDQNFENNNGDARWRMREHWRAATRLDHNWWGIYYMYATTKGMRSFSPEINRFENGEDWATKFAHFLIRHTAHGQENYWRWCSSNNDHHCHWHWHGSFNTHTTTVIATQIVQTWLEAQAMARANPQSTGPGIPVTFDHSWSHILDPNVSLSRFRWNVIDGPGEGGEPANMNWEYTTDDLNAPFVYTYDANLGWDQVINKKVTLEVTDSQGRSVYDDKSVSITLSLKNHKPVVIAHPDGRNGIYSGYFGQTFALDASRSYETDQCIRDREDPNLPGGAAADIPRPEAVVVEVQDCDALDAEMQACLDGAAPGDVEAILRCVEMQTELERCRVMDEELQNCLPAASAIEDCRALIAAGEADELEEGVEPPANCNPEEAALAQCRADAIASVNDAINAALIAEWEEAVGGGDDGGGDEDGNCGNRELFPGDGNRPRGRPDRVTSICFDTNFNDRWCENGEVQYEWHNGAAPRINAPVAFTPRQGMGEGDIIGIPVRVCDDGRWNGKCYQPGDGGPGNLTRGDCSECGYGTASIQVVQNAEPPNIEFNEPGASPAVGKITIGETPDDKQFVDITDHQDRKMRFHFDHQTAPGAPAVTAPEGTVTFTGVPLNDETFRLKDHTGNERRYVFKSASELADGSTSDVQGIPHIAIGTSGAGNLSEVANRFASAVNATAALDITATTAQNTATLTQNAIWDPPANGVDHPKYEGNQKIDMADVHHVETNSFVGGVRVGVQGIQNDTNAVAEQVRAAVDRYFPGAATRTNNVVTVRQAEAGFDGNSVIDVSNADGVRSKDFAGGRSAGLVVAPGQKVSLDFSPGRDPEGVLGQALDTNGIFYRYELARGRGYILPTRGFERRASGNDGHPDPDNWSNWGMAPQIVPRGDGPVDMTVRVRARDYGGREATQDIDIRLLNEPPVIDGVETDVYARGPQIDPDQQVEIGNLGNRRYRVVVEARPDPGVDASLNYRAHDKYGQDVTATADLDGDGNADGDAVAGNAGRFTLTFNNVPDGGQNYNARVEVSDGNDSVTKIIRIYVPSISAEAAANMRYSIDVGNDGSMELVNSRSNNVEFRLPPGQNTIGISGSVEANGQRIPFDLGAVSMPNEAPRFQNPRLVSQDGFDVVVAASATDRDGDPVIITVDWGDGTTSRGRNVIYRHSYANARFQEYTVRMRATDDRGLFDEHSLTVDILRPAIKESDVSSLTWTRVTETEGNYDGIRGFAIDPAGTLFTHNYMDIVRRSTNGGDDWTDVLRDIECCGGIATKNAGEVYVASPSGLYFSGDNGDNWELYDESKFLKVAVSPDKNFIVAATKDEVKRFDTTGRFIDTYRVVGEVSDLEACSAGNRSAFTSRVGQMFINDRRDMNPAGWRIPEDRFAKGKGESSVSFDKSCNLYQGMWNGYRILKADNSIEPSSVKVPKHLFHPLGSNSKNIYGGTGSIYDILAWPEGAAIIGADRGIWGENEPWNAYRKPYWKKRDRGVDRSKTVRGLLMHPTSGFAYMATSSAVQLPKYCRKARRGARGRRRRGRRARVQYYYVFCGFTQNFYGGLYRSVNPLLLSRTVGEGGREFDPRYGRGVSYDGNQGGLVVSNNEDEKAFLWLVNTAESTISKWDPGRNRPAEVGKYRVGIPAGECPGSCCWNEGCNMAGPVAIDSAGDAYIASRGFGMQGTVTKIAGDVERCVDRNNNGRIETSRNGEAMAYGEDECVIWTRPVGPVNAVLRALAVDQGDVTHPNGYVWVGGYNTQAAWKLNPETGEVLTDIELGVPAYGMVVTSSGTMYVSTLGLGQLQVINTITNQAGRIVDNPGGLRGGGNSSYGVAIDGRGRIWMNGWGTPDAIAYDPADGTWCRMGLPFGMNVGRGITMDPSGRMWAAVGGDGASHIAFWDADDCVSGQSNDVPRRQLIAMENGITGPSAVSSDEKGRIWLAHHSSEKLVMIEPDNNFRVTTFDGTNRVFSFSDVSGLQRRMSIGQGSYEHDFEADCDNPQWTALDWNARTPAGSSISFTAQTAARRAKLVEGATVNVGRSPGDLGPINLSGRMAADNVESRRFLRIRASLTLGDDKRSPVLQTFTVRWNCD